MIFQRCQHAILWSKGLNKMSWNYLILLSIKNYSSCMNDDLIYISHSSDLDTGWNGNKKDYLCQKLLVWCFMSQSTAVVMLRWSVYLTTLFLLGKSQAVDQYFAHTYSNPSWISGREENGCINYFMVNLCKSMGLGRDWNCYPSICSQTRYWLWYMAGSLSEVDICMQTSY